MLKAIVLMAVVFILMIFLFSIPAVHIELWLTGFTPKFAWSAVFWPFSFIPKGNISWGLVIGTGVAAMVAQIFYRALFVRRLGWVTEEQFQQIVPGGKR
jgi:hypothetical protein